RVYILTGYHVFLVFEVVSDDLVSRFGDKVGSWFLAALGFRGSPPIFRRGARKAPQWKAPRSPALRNSTSPGPHIAASTLCHIAVALAVSWRFNIGQRGWRETFGSSRVTTGFQPR